MNQLGFPSTVTTQEIEREKSLGAAIELCVKVAGLEPKEAMDAIRDPKSGKAVDKGQWHRWTEGTEGIVWPKFVTLMDFCGNDAPLLWMLQARGYDLSSLRRQETETEKENRLLREELARERQERAVERRLFTELRSA